MESSYLYFIRITSIVMYRIRRKVKRERLIIKQLEKIRLEVIVQNDSGGDRENCSSTADYSKYRF